VTTAVVRAYRFAVDPTPPRKPRWASHCGAQRSAVDWGLALVTANLGQRHAETSCGIPAGELIPAVGVVGVQPAEAVEPGQRRDGAVVGGELQGGVRVGPGEPRDRACATGPRRVQARGPAGSWGFLGSGASGWGCRAGSPPARSAWPGIVGMCGCRVSPTVRTHESTRTLARHVEHGRARIRSGTPHVSVRALVLPRSPWRSPAPTPPPPGPAAWSVWISV
jgi:putative transposase